MFTLFSNNNGGVRLLLGVFALIGAAVLVVIDQVIKFLATTYIKPIGTLEIIPEMMVLRLEFYPAKLGFL